MYHHEDYENLEYIHAFFICYPFSLFLHTLHALISGKMHPWPRPKMSPNLSLLAASQYCKPSF